MRLGAHSAQISPALDDADVTIFLHRPELAWNADIVVATLRGQGESASSVEAMIERLAQIAQPGDHLVFMSNGGFEGAPRRALAALGWAAERV